MTSEGPRLVDLLFVAVVALLLHAPRLGAPEYDHEEGRRALIARDALETGELVVPRVFGRPHLTKPPGLPLAMAAASLPGGEVTTTSARVPSLVATVLTACLVCALGTRLTSSRAGGVLAGALVVAMPMVLEKGTLAETEALLALTCTGAVACLVAGRGVLAGLCLGAALLVKGPAALVFFLPAPLALGLAGRERLRAALVALAVGLGLFGVWAALLLLRLDADAVRAVWADEVTRGGSAGYGPSYLENQLRSALRVVVGLLPGIVVVAGGFLSRPRRPWLRTPLARAALAVVALGLLFFLLFPGTRARYSYPVVPWVALLAAGVLRDACTGESRAADRALLAVTVVLYAAVGIAAWTVTMTPQVAERALGIETSGALDLYTRFSLAAGLGALGALIARQRDVALGLALVALALVRAAQLAEFVPAVADRHERRALAARFDAALPEGRPAWTAFWQGYNELAHVETRLVFTHEPLADVAVGDALLVEESAAPAGDWRRLERVALPQGTLLVLERTAR